MSYLPELRSSLVAAAERIAEPPGMNPRRRWLATGLRRWPVTGLRAIPVALGVAVAVAIAVLALTQVRHAPTHARPMPTTKQPPGRQALINILGVLRRPQTAADRNSRVLTRNLQGPAHGVGALAVTPDYPLIRRATTTPWGSPVFLVPVKPLPVKAIHAPPGSTEYAPLQRRTSEGLMEVDRSGSGGDATASTIEAGHFLGTTGAGRSFAGGSTATRLILVVPDGVARVAFVFPRQADRNDAGAPVYRRSLTVTATVQGNVAAVQVPRECCGSNLPMIWYAPDGHVVKRLGNFREVNRVLPTPKPGPETSQSRAAERDPSTPNHLWVTPAAGGPHAPFTVHFRLLLSDAGYRFTFSGTKCPQLTFAGGQGGPAEIRGRIFSGVLDAVHGQTWCPGT
ncbi:MAG: hypothetical protein ACRDPM_20085, partial [Solirubrobacteraceae bacterium]